MPIPFLLPLLAFIAWMLATDWRAALATIAGTAFALAWPAITIYMLTRDA
jgi:hypothetical protein